jgi:Zn-dependent protease
LPSTEFLILWGVLLLFSLSVHEASHAWTADQLGDPTARQLGRITLNPLSHIDWIGTVLLPVILIYSNQPPLGWAKPVPVAAAGPISNLVLAVIGAVLFTALRGRAADPVGGEFLATALFQMVQLNVGLAIFNMIPVPPLDGGNVLSGFVPESVARMLDRLRGPVGFVLIYVMIYTGVLGTVLGPLRLAIMRWLL